MAAMSNYLENKLIDFLFRAQAFSAPTTIYIGLLTTNPGDTGTLTEIGSPTANGYARASVSCALATFKSTQDDNAVSSGVTGYTSNTSSITFPSPSGGNWFYGAGPSASTITHFGIFDSASGGNMLFWGALASSKTVSLGDSPPSFLPGSLIIQLDN